MIVIGLTGSIGMGKSTTAALFAKEGIPVNDADRVVHELYRGAAVEPVGKAFPGTVVAGAIDRRELSRQLAENPAKFRLLEEIVHPLVRDRETQFLMEHRKSGVPMVVLDIPLLFEVGGEHRVDRVVLASCDPRTQRDRVLARPGMTLEKFELIVSRQMPDEEKRARADFVIETGNGLEPAREQVRAVIRRIKGETA